MTCVLRALCATAARGGLGDLRRIELVGIVPEQDQLIDGAQPDQVGDDIGLRREQRLVGVVVEQGLLGTVTSASEVVAQVTIAEQGPAADGCPSCSLFLTPL